ncbi:MAG: glycosyltransferase family 2 protein [Bacteroidales bacterium]|jgi:glycosyltransferase involved in cell wall biosynthesis|nr:glycosyltransferase family 2 protein [Bacteroidales bacterium]
MQSISAVIITFNEELYIGKCLESLKGIADEIIVVDSFSTDSTADICKKHGVKLVQHEFTGFMDQKNYSLTLASNKYILSLDADEALSEELKKSILEVKKNISADGYYFSRLNNFCGKWMKHSAWYPDKQLRLFNKEMGKWGPINVHETFQMIPCSRISRIKGDLLHWTFTSKEEFTEKIKNFSNIAANDYFKAGKKAWPLTPSVHMLWRFFLNYFLHFGFLDGRYGFLVCWQGARSSFLKYSILRKLNRDARK